MNTATAGKVLVLGADRRSGLAIIRSLGRGKIEVHAASHRHDPLTLRSRYLRQAHVIPAYTDASTEWKTALSSLMKHEGFDLVLPSNDMWVSALQRHRSDLERLGNLYLLSDHAFEVLFDKLKTSSLARSLGIPVPEEVVISQPEDLSRALATCGAPVFLKPARSFHASDADSRHVVRRAYTEAELMQHARAMLRFGPIAAQRYFAGRGVGVEMLVRDGRLLLAFQHERVHERPGGGSSYRKGVALSHPLVDAAQKLLRHVAYTGVAMVEFRVNPATAEWVLLEVNARFWGSLPLAVASGADFPLALYRLLTQGQTCFPQGYREGLYSRDLSAEVDWYLDQARARRSGKAPGLWSRLGNSVHTAAAIAGGRERIDTFALDDPMPFFAEVDGLRETYSGRMRSRLSRRWHGLVTRSAALQ